MIPKSIIGFLVVLCLLAFSACKEEVEKDVTEFSPNQEHAMFDTLFGELTDQEQYYQHFLVEIPATYQTNIDSLCNWLVTFKPGGIRFMDWNQDSVTRVKFRLDTLMNIQPIYFANFFSYLDLPEYPYWDVSPKNCDLKWTQVFTNDHIGLVDFNRPFPSEEYTTWTKKWEQAMGAQFISKHFKDTNVVVDFDLFRTALKSSDQLVQLNLTHFDTVQLNRFRTIYDYKGQFVLDVNTDAVNTQLKGGADFIRVELSPTRAQQFPYSKWQIDGSNRSAFDQSTQRILAAKANLKFQQVFRPSSEQKESVRLNVAVQSCALLNNKSNALPLTKGAYFFAVDKWDVATNLKIDNKLKVVQDDLLEIESLAKKDGTKIIFLPDTLTEKQIESIKKVKRNQETVFCFSSVSLYNSLRETPNLVFIHPLLRKKENASLMSQLFSRQLNLDGNFSNYGLLVKGEKILKTKLGYASPSFCGLSSDTLRKIDYAVNTAISGKAFPGCQVSLAKDGYIFYEKSYGRYTYEDAQPITNEAMYDIASLTKVVATTMVGMLLYERGAYRLTDSLKDYLPDSLSKHLTFPSTIRNITFQELFTHKSGLPAGFPLLNYLQYTNANIGRLDKYYCDRPDSVYSIEVADNFYLEEAYRDTMWLRLNKMWLDPSKEYKYSDVNMNTLYFIFKSILHNNPDKYGFKLKKEEMKTRDLFVEFLYENIYNQLLMTHTKYKPLRHYPKNQIVPTENERFWRKQLLQGHVHDPNAALYGGIAGNAGVFSTSHDLAILCEMLRQKGTYAGKRYFKAETVSQFTAAQPNSFRGLGFNKPSLNTSAFGCANAAPPETFGHTGFTGTCIWVDPVNNISFVFLSNRVYPQVNNRIYQYGIRRNIHQLAYDSFLFTED